MWTILVIWGAVTGTPQQDMWLIINPTFASHQECVYYGQKHRDGIIRDAMIQWQTDTPPDKIYCIDEVGRDILAKRGIILERS